MEMKKNTQMKNQFQWCFKNIFLVTDVVPNKRKWLKRLHDYEKVP